MAWQVVADPQPGVKVPCTAAPRVVNRVGVNPAGDVVRTAYAVCRVPPPTKTPCAVPLSVNLSAT